MNKFREAALLTYKRIKNSKNILTRVELGNIWQKSCKDVGLEESTSKKTCPKNIFISLYENGFLKKCNSKDKIMINENNKILIDILSKLKQIPKEEKISIRKIWREIAGVKEYNSEIDVILPLYKDNINKYILINETVLFEEGVKKMHLSYSFAKEIKHFVEFEEYKFKHYEFYPTNFLYAFMSFNMIYDLFEEIEMGKNRKKYSNKTKDRIEKALSYLTDLELKNIRVINNEKQTDDLKKNLIGKTEERERIKEMLYYIYTVRNNFFHGSKKASDYINDGQRDRMYSYTEIILEFCDVFFQKINREGLKLSKDYELIDNLISWENKN